MPKDDLIRIRHMYDAARDTLDFVMNKTRSDLDGNRILALSLEGIIRISEATKP